MRKTVRLSEDGFIRATEISKLLETGWTIIPTDVLYEIIAEKADLNEDVADLNPVPLWEKT